MERFQLVRAQPVSKRAAEVLTDRFPGRPVPPHAPETRMVVLGALAALPPRARAVVVLRYWEDLSVDQVAAVLGCSPGNVKSLAAGALGKLRADAVPIYSQRLPCAALQYGRRPARPGALCARLKVVERILTAWRPSQAAIALALCRVRLDIRPPGDA